MPGPDQTEGSGRSGRCRIRSAKGCSVARQDNPGSNMPAGTDVQTETVLRNTARQALLRAYARYSAFQVGAALLSESGHVYPGCNVENTSSAMNICAERVAIGHAVAAEGPAMRIRALAIAAMQPDPSSGLLVDQDIAPCGICRQVIAEFAGKDCPVFYRKAGKDVVKTIGELLPDAFSKPPRAD